jgi:biopolymer transport protein ExbD
MAFKEIKVQEEISPNLIPMIDIMFLLLLFFMLNADMSQRELEEITPPIATHAVKDEPQPGSDRITVNIHHDTKDEVDCPLYATGDICRNDVHWHISMSGRKYNFDKEGMTRLAQALTELGKTKREDPNNAASPSARNLIIRADRTAPYGFIQKVLEQATTGGIYKIEVGAGLPKEELNKQK